MLRSLEESVSGDVDAEAAGACEDFDDAVGAHATEKTLICQSCESCSAIAVENVLTSLDLVPIDPVWDGSDFIP